MAKRTQQLDLPSEIAEVAQSAAPVAEKAPEVTPDQIAQLILKGSDDTKAAIRRALDLDKTHARVRKNKNQTNSQVRNTVKAIGEVTHADGFVPDPPRTHKRPVVQRQYVYGRSVGSITTATTSPSMTSTIWRLKRRNNDRQRWAD
jgi:hypothetical protein